MRRVDVELRVVPSRDGTTIPWWGYAGVRWSDTSAVIFVLEGHETPKRVGHELAHLVDRKTGSTHHAWWHCCLRVGHGLRTWAHRDGVTDAAVFELIKSRRTTIP